MEERVNRGNYIPSMIAVLAGVSKSLAELLVISGATAATLSASSGGFGSVFVGLRKDVTLGCKI